MDELCPGSATCAEMKRRPAPTSSSVLTLGTYSIETSQFTNVNACGAEVLLKYAIMRKASHLSNELSGAALFRHGSQRVATMHNCVESTSPVGILQLDRARAEMRSPTGWSPDGAADVKQAQGVSVPHSAAKVHLEELRKQWPVTTCKTPAATQC